MLDLVLIVLHWTYDQQKKKMQFSKNRMQGHPSVTSHCDKSQHISYAMPCKVLHYIVKSLKCRCTSLEIFTTENYKMLLDQLGAHKQGIPSAPLCFLDVWSITSHSARRDSNSWYTLSFSMLLVFQYATLKTGNGLGTRLLKFCILS